MKFAIYFSEGGLNFLMHFVVYFSERLDFLVDFGILG